MAKERPVKTRNLIAYGMGDIFGGGSFLLISMFYLFFLTEEVGLPPWLASIVIGIGKVWDAVSDPMMGYLSDRTRTRYGRRRVYFLLGIVPIAVSFYLLWIPMEAGGIYATAAYYALAYVVFNTVFTMVMIPYSALNAEMSSDYRVRTRLTAARTLFSLLSAGLAGTVPAAILKAAATPQDGYLKIAMLFGLIYALPWLLVYWGTWEAAPAPADAGTTRPRFRLSAALLDMLTLLRNRTFRVHLAMYISAYTAIDALMILFRYYLKWNIGNENLMTVSMGALMIGQILAIPVYVVIANVRGKAVAYRAGLTIFAVGMVLSYFVTEKTQAPMLMAVCLVIGIGLSAAVMMPWAILPSVIDVDEIMTGQVRSGTYAGSMTLVRKLVQGAIATPMIGFALGAIGYVEKADVQSPATVADLKTLFFLIPSAAIALGIVASLGFRITPQTHAVLARELERLRAGGKQHDAEPATIKVIEMLTGTPYGGPGGPGSEDDAKRR